MNKRHSSNTEYSMSAVLPLPFVNMDPSNLSTIYTCLQYVAEQRSKCGQSRIIVTFNQPLYAKAREMVLAAGPHSPLSGVVIRLGGFRDSTSCFPSWVRSVSLWPEVDWKRCGRPYNYAKNSVVHMMNGRAYVRGIRAHFISQSALATLLLGSSTVDDSLKKDVVKHVPCLCWITRQHWRTSSIPIHCMALTIFLARV